MVDLLLLKSTIDERGVKIVSIAEKMEISREGLYKKLSGDAEFKASEIEKITDALRLSKSERDSIFFAKEVERNSTEED
ncbi:MAG: toxin-antitoxin system, antitoxin component, Xre family protein [Clostridiales bacterium]|nr:toxin-antitoxin system, antitoxin component, Xre family protein [Clostridiales bacterium]